MPNKLLTKGCFLLYALCLLGFSQPILAGQSKSKKIVVLAKKKPIEQQSQALNWSKEQIELASDIFLPLDRQQIIQKPEKLFVFTSPTPTTPVQVETEPTQKPVTKTAKVVEIKKKEKIQTPNTITEEPKKTVQFEMALNDDLPLSDKPSQTPNTEPELAVLKREREEETHSHSSEIRQNNDTFASALVAAVNDETPATSYENDLPQAEQVNLNETSELQSQTLFFQHDIKRTKQKVIYTNIEVQLIDERSNIVTNEIYPLAGIDVRLIGTNLIAKSDLQGRVLFKNLPNHGRYLVDAVDPEGRVINSSLEIQVNPESVGKVYFKMLRQISFDQATQAADSVQRSDAGSICGRVLVNGTPEAKKQLSLNIKSDGPYYTNAFGIIESRLGESSEDGSYCFFNVPEGLSVLTVSEGESAGFHVPVNIKSGNHQQKDIHITDLASLRLLPAIGASAYHQIHYTNSAASESLNPIDNLKLYPLGYDVSLKIENQIVESHQQLLGVGQNIYIYAQAAGLEPAIYQLPKLTTNRVLRLYPRGYFSDVASEASMIVDYSKGRMLIEHGFDQNYSDIIIKIYDENNQEITEHHYDYMSDSTARKVIGNLEPGAYVIVVSDSAGNWLDSQISYVYENTMSVVNTGSYLIFK